MESTKQPSKNDNVLEGERQTAKKYEKDEITGVEMEDVNSIKPEKHDEELSKAPKGKVN